MSTDTSEVRDGEASSGSTVVLEADDVVAGYVPEVDILSGTSLQLFDGELVGVIGPNGAGKTTLLCAAMGLLPSSGSLSLGGERIARPSVEAMVARGVALVPERRELFGEMPVEDNLLLGGFYRWRTGRRDQKERMEEVFAIFPRMKERRAQLASTLSGGERQMLAVGRALMAKPRSSLSEKAEKFLNHELHHEISVSQLAEHCGTSERSLLRHFRAHLGVSPVEHIQHLRVERAKALLETTHLSFDEIVERCGYSDSASFRKLFKRATAITPGDYRERYRLRPY